MPDKGTYQAYAVQLGTPLVGADRAAAGLR